MRVRAVRTAENLAVALGDGGPLGDQHTAVSALFVSHHSHLRESRLQRGCQAGSAAITETLSHHRRRPEARSHPHNAAK